MAQTKSYQIVEGFDKINGILQMYGKSFLEDAEQIDYNYAFVHRFDDGQVLLSSNDGLIGILFKDSSIFSEMLDKRTFPVPDPPSIFAKERSFVRNLDENIDEYVKRLNPLGIDSVPEHEGIDACLMALSGKISLVGKDKVDDRTYVALGIFVGEIMRRELGGLWKWRQEPGINPYYIPYVVDKNGLETLHWKWFHEHWKKKKRVALNILLMEMLEFHSKL